MEQSEEEFKKTEDARKRMEEDLGEGDDHLDVTLEDEGAYLQQYKKLMNIVWYTYPWFLHYFDNKWSKFMLLCPFDLFTILMSSLWLVMDFFVTG